MAARVPAELSRLLEASDSATSEQAWDAFVSQHSRLLLHTARSTSPDSDAAMDAYAHVLEALRRDGFRRLRAYVPDDRTKFTTWLVVVTRRLCIDRLRQQFGRLSSADSGQPDVHITHRRLADLVSDVDPDLLSRPSHDDPGSGLESEERHHAIRTSVAALDPRDRLLLGLRFEQNLSAREIAGLMGFPTPFHVYRRLNAVLALLKQSLLGHGVDKDGT